MNEASIRRSDDRSVAVVGTIDVTNAMKLKVDGEKLIKGMANPISVDLSGIIHSGSVGVSILLAWVRAAQAEGKEITYINIPAKMFDVARVSGLDEVLPLKH